MNDIKLIGLDLDGTVFDHNKHISTETLDTIKDAIAQGIPVVPVTGRPYSGLPQILMDIPGIDYAVTANGAALFDARTDTCIYRNCLSNEQAFEILNLLRPYPLVLDFFSNGHGYMEQRSRSMINRLPVRDAVKSYWLSTRQFIPSFEALLNEHPDTLEKVSINFFPKDNGTGRKYGDTVHKKLETILDITLVSSAPVNYEINARTATKATGLNALGQILNIRLSEIMVCGDDLNDLDMITQAGMGVAMGNGREEIKNAADFVTKSNEENGVAFAIRKLVLNNL